MKRVIYLILLMTALLLAALPARAQEIPAPEVTETPVPESTAAPLPDVRFGRDFSSGYAEYGDYVTISYTVRNNGELPMENIVIEDGLVGEVGSISLLEPGKKKTFNIRFRVVETCTSTPEITYEYNGETYTEKRSGEKIHLANVKLSVVLDADRTNVAPGEIVTLRVKLVNDGNVNLYGLKAGEPVLGEMGSLVSVLRPGQEHVFTRTVQMKSMGTFQFEVSGTSDTGNSVAVYSNELSVLVTPVAAQIQLTMGAQANTTELYGPGKVAFSLYLNNACSLELRNVLISEETRGVIRELMFVPTGQMPVITAEYDVSESGTYRFMAQVTDSVGDLLTVYSDSIDIAVLEATAAPSAEVSPRNTAAADETPEPEEKMIPLLDGAPYRMEENPATFEKLMVGTSLLLLAILLGWYIAVKIRKSSARRKRARERKKQKKNKRASSKK